MPVFKAASETDGIQQHLQNTGINGFNPLIVEYPSFGDTIKSKTYNGILEPCISDTFVVYINEDILFSLTLTEDCKFILIDHQSNEQINGGYSILGKIIKGSMSTIIFSIDGESREEAILAWPVEDDLCLIIDGVTFRKKDKTHKPMHLMGY